VSISDRASTGVYEDEGLPALREWLSRALLNPIDWEARLIPDEQAVIAATLRELVDGAGCNLVLTTGGTGPAPRDVTPEATLAIEGLGGVRFAGDAVLARQLARARRQLLDRLPEQRDLVLMAGGVVDQPLHRLRQGVVALRQAIGREAQLGGRRLACRGGVG